MWELAWVDEDVEYITGAKWRLPRGDKWKNLYALSIPHVIARNPIYINCTGSIASSHKYVWVRDHRLEGCPWDPELIEYRETTGRFKSILLRSVPATPILITWKMLPNDDRTKWLAQVFFAASGNQLGVVIVPAEHEGRLMVTDLTRIFENQRHSVHGISVHGIAGASSPQHVRPARPWRARAADPAAHLKWGQPGPEP